MSVFSIGKNALNAANYALNVTAHNANNAYTAGYSRQQVLQSSVLGLKYGFGYVGYGTQLNDVRRVYDQFVYKQYVGAQSTYSNLSTYYNQVEKMNNLLGGETTGLSTSITDMFDAIQDVASMPSELATREVLISQLQSMVSRYNTLSKEMNDQLDIVNSQLKETITQVNTLAEGIAKLNQQISMASAGGQKPNDLLDQRDYMVLQLSELLDISTVQNGNNIDVYFGNGQPLVSASNSYQLAVTADSATLEFSLIMGSGREVGLSTSMFKGGAIAGYIAVRENELTDALNELGILAATIAMNMNDQHRLGIDLNGELGEALFAFQATSHALSKNGNDVSATISDASKLSASDYKIESTYDGTTYRYTITRLSDGYSESYSNPVTPLASITVDGIIFDPSSMTNGDSVTLKPYANVASSLELLITDPGKLAAGYGLLASADAGNLGTGVISSGEVTSSNWVNIPDTTLTYNGGNLTATTDLWVTSPSTGTTTHYAAGASIPYEEGATYDAGGFQFTITGTPENTDVFTISANNGSGDNRNMLAIADLQTTKTMNGGTQTYQSYYAQWMSRLGSKTSSLETQSDMALTRLEQLYAEHQSISGVDLDEEAINLYMYQNNYNAAAQFISVANEMFATILGIF